MPRSELATLAFLLVLINSGCCSIAGVDVSASIELSTTARVTSDAELNNEVNVTNTLNEALFSSLNQNETFLSDINNTIITSTKKNETQVNDLEKTAGQVDHSSTRLDEVSGEAEASSNATRLNNPEVVTSEDQDKFKDDGRNETVLPWWRRRPYPLRQRAPPCECNDYTCGCCAGMSIQRLNISQNGCLNFRYDPDEFSIEMEVRMNGRSIVRRSVSGKNPPPLCIPLPNPVPFIPSVEFCTRIFNVFTPGRNLHMCMDWTTKINQAPVLEVQFDCLRMGADGVAVVKPDAGGGLAPDVTGGGGGGDYGVIEGSEGEDYDQLEPDYPEAGNKRPSKPLKPMAANSSTTTPAT